MHNSLFHFFEGGEGGGEEEAEESGEEAANDDDPLKVIREQQAQIEEERKAVLENQTMIAEVSFMLYCFWSMSLWIRKENVLLMLLTSGDMVMLWSIAHRWENI